MAAMDAKTQAELADMMLALSHNPATRPMIARAAKEAKLPVTFHDIEAQEATTAAARQAARDAVAADQETRRKDAVTQRTAADRAELVSSGRFSEETVKKLETYMSENGIGDYRNGAILFAHDHPQAAPHSEIAQSRMWEMPKGDWVKDPHGTARKLAHEVIGEIAAARR